MSKQELTPFVREWLAVIDKMRRQLHRLERRLLTELNEILDDDKPNPEQPE